MFVLFYVYWNIGIGIGLGQKGKDDRWSELSADCQAGSVCCSPRISPDLAFAFLSVRYNVIYVHFLYLHSCVSVIFLVC